MLQAATPPANRPLQPSLGQRRRPKQPDTVNQSGFRVEACRKLARACREPAGNLRARPSPEAPRPPNLSPAPKPSRPSSPPNRLRLSCGYGIMSNRARPTRRCANLFRSIGAAGAQLPYKQWVGGSNPSSTTTKNAGRQPPSCRPASFSTERPPKGTPPPDRPFSQTTQALNRAALFSESRSPNPQKQPPRPVAPLISAEKAP